MFWDFDKRKLMLLSILSFLVASTFIVLLSNVTVSFIRQQFYDRELALVGLIQRSAPQEVEEAALIFLGKENQSARQDGIQIMTAYAADTAGRMSEKSGYRVVSAAVFGLSTTTFLLTVGFLLLFTFRQQNRQEKLLKEYLFASDRMLEGEISFNLRRSGDGITAALGESLMHLGGRLQYTIEKLQKEKVFLSDMLSDISHQLKTPVSTIKVYAEAMKNHPEIDEAKRVECVSSLYSQTERLEWLVHSLLRVARLEAGAVYYKKSMQSVSDTVKLACEGLLSGFEEAGIHLETHDSGEEIELYHDRAWTAEALSNIIKNSCEHGKAGGITHVTISQTPLTVSIQIRDDGEGIPENQLPRIFDRFYKGSSAVKSSNIGIGLSIAKVVLEQQGGDISVKSKYGEGTEFVITFLKSGGRDMEQAEV